MFCASGARWSTLSPRLCRLAVVLRCQLLSAFILLNLQPYQYVLDYMQPPFTFLCFIPQKEKTVRAGKSQYGNKVCLIYSETNAWDGPASARIRERLKLGRKHPNVCPEGGSVRASHLSKCTETHLRLICIRLHLQWRTPLHLHHSSGFFIGFNVLSALLMDILTSRSGVPEAINVPRLVWDSRVRVHHIYWKPWMSRQHQ